MAPSVMSASPLCPSSSRYNWLEFVIKLLNGYFSVIVKKEKHKNKIEFLPLIKHRYKKVTSSPFDM